jgi:hypothetical protein
MVLAPRRCASRPARDLSRRRHPGRGVPRARAQAFRDALADIGVIDVVCELFDATHGAIDYRYPRGIACLAERLAP